MKCKNVKCDHLAYDETYCNSYSKHFHIAMHTFRVWLATLRTRIISPILHVPTSALFQPCLKQYHLIEGSGDKTAYAGRIKRKAKEILEDTEGKTDSGECLHNISTLNLLNEIGYIFSHTVTANNAFK